MTEISVAAAAPYQVHIGAGEVAKLATLVPPGVARIALVFDSKLAEFADQIREQLSQFQLLMCPVASGESAKDSQVAIEIWTQLGAAGFTRSDLLITLGGGATTDLGGFVAATWLRGIQVIHLPTTLLAMVDAAVGGKTGINTPAGKNLVGAFHEPAAVICDLTWLASLPAAEFISGMAEVIKCGFIADPEILQLLESVELANFSVDHPLIAELVCRAVQVKATVVSADLKETGLGGGIGREALNYGHTLGHAIEKLENYQIRHGEAISIGMVFIAELGLRLKMIDAELVALHKKILAGIGLPITYSGTAEFSELLAAMAIDKKTRGNQIRLVMLQGLAQPVILPDPSETDLIACFTKIQG